MTQRLDRSATALAAAMLLAYGAAAGAADTRSGAAGAPSDRTGASTQAPSSGAAATTAPAAATAQSIRDLRMSELVGMDVRNAGGENLGDIKDVVVDTRTGRIQYAVVGIGGFLGIGEKLSAFPMSAFQVASAGAPAGGAAASGARTNGDAPAATARTDAGTPATTSRADAGMPATTARPGVAASADGTRADGTATTAARALPARANRDMHMVLNANPDRLKDAPNFDADKWPDWNDPKYRGTVDKAAGATGANGGGRLVRGSQLMDAKIRDAQGKEIGEIEDLVVDVRNARVHYAVVDFERGWTPDDRLVAVPMGALRTAGETGELVFSGDRSRLANAPGFEKNRWPDLNATSFRSQLDRYLSSWSGDTPARATTTPGTGMSGAPTDPSRGTTAGSPAPANRTAPGGTAPSGTSPTTR